MARVKAGPKVRAKQKAKNDQWKKDRDYERSETIKDAKLAAKRGIGIYPFIRAERIESEGIKVPDEYSAKLLKEEGDNVIGTKKKK